MDALSPKPMSVTPTGSDDLANALLIALTKGTDFTVPDVDLNGPEFELPPSTGPNYDSIKKLTDDDLTTGKVGGTGMFDQIMVSLAAHLKVEYTANRIAGAEYTKAYIGVIGAGLQTASQYLLAKDQSYWQAVMVQMQARAAEIEVVKARVDLEIAKATLVRSQYEAHTAEAQYGLTKMQIANADAEFANRVATTAGILYTTANLMPAQLAHQKEETTGLDYTNTYILPAQLAHQKEVTSGLDYTNTNLLPAQLKHQQEETQQVAYTNDFLLPQQLAKSKEEVDALVYTTTFLMPEQLAHSKAQTTGIVYTNTALLPEQLAQSKAQTATIVYTNTNILPQQLAKSKAEVAALEYTYKTMMPAQKIQVDKQNINLTYTGTGLDYTNKNILPLQKALVNEQVQVQRAQTYDKRTEGMVITGAVGKQKALYDQQMAAYQRDSENKLVKFYIDAYLTQKTVDEDFPIPLQFKNTEIDEILKLLRKNLALGS